MNFTAIETAFRTHRGRVREVNEDSVGVYPESGLMILADGMGGHSAGEMASQLAVETVASSLLSSCHEGDLAPEEDIADAVAAANRLIVENAAAVPEWSGMGTTLLLGCFGDGVIHYGHIGDSRLYLFRERRLKCLTEDHSLIQQLVADGTFSSVEEAKSAGVKSNTLLRGLGRDSEPGADVGKEALKEGDIFLFCSDGLSNMVQDSEIEEILDSSTEGLEAAVEQLLSVALDNGGLDNVSLILARPGKGKTRIMDNQGLGEE